MESGKIFFVRILLFFVLVCAILFTCQIYPVNAETSEPPSKPIKLIFIHHSCGENWLTNGNGGLGRSLGDNNYFVSDTNYGWGPNSIGDRTDITNWPEWFTGANSRQYLQALYSENGQHSEYRRKLRDPGGENRIVMFKSCFPNSNLEGRPGDSPARSDGLTVANAKAIYNELLTYFSSRPDKLFIAVTAPPVLDRSYAKNARAFNTWLVKEWLNGYAGNNVAVFDFYNVLTGSGNHHRFTGGKIEHIIGGSKNTLHYPSGGDEHPTAKGNRKATKEFVGLLNYYYNRWYTGAPETVALGALDTGSETEQAPPVETPETAPTPSEPVTGNLIDDFESENDTWTVFSDESPETRLTFRYDDQFVHEGKTALGIEYHIPSESWATCSLVYPSHRDWRKKSGITFYIHADQPNRDITVVVYNGSSSNKLQHFECVLSTLPEAAEGWQRVEMTWDQFVQPPWEGGGTKKFDPGKVLGIAFVPHSSDGGMVEGHIWVDTVGFMD